MKQNLQASRGKAVKYVDKIQIASLNVNCEHRTLLVGRKLGLAKMDLDDASIRPGLRTMD
jgi:hypothetical protein